MSSPPVTPALPTSTSSITTSTSSSDSSRSSTSSTSSSSSTSSTSTSTSTSSSSTSSSTSTTTTPTTRTSTTTNRSSNVVTQTSTTFVSASKTGVVAPTSTLASGGSKPFLQNTAAVAGVFSAIGLVSIVVIFFLAKNFIRRRKQVAFDRELQEATRQAAAVSAAPFDDDDDDPYTKRGVYGTADSYRDRQYSDMSHGTYGQNAMSVESYGMREIGHPPIPMAADVYSSDPYTAGAAGIGVARARSMRLDGQGSHSRQPDFSVALSEGNAPYAAFAAPNPGNMPGGSGDPYAATQNLELLDATGLGKHMAGAGSLARASSQIHYPHQMQQDGGYGGYPLPGLDRSRSMGVPAQYYPAGTVHPYATATPVNNMNRYSVVNEDMEDAYGGVDDGGPDPSANMHTPGTGRDIVAQREDYLPNPFESGSNDGHMRGDTESIGQEEPRRVLKVANE